MQEQTIERIRKSLDIVDVIGEYVQLKKQGKNYMGLCPFHDERTPSFSVSPDKQLYHCFGCGAGGNLFTFIMEIEGLSFAEAALFLARKADIDVGDVSVGPRQSGKNGREQKELTDDLNLLTKFYHYLLVNAKYGSAGMDYLVGRGLSESAIERFQLGYAVNSWSAAASLVARRGLDAELLTEAGILGKRGFDNKYFDRFRDRVMFPIFNRRGQVVAFAGRTLGHEKPKYLNTPESHVFKKGSILYGFHLARPAIRKANQVILLEGYMDVIRAHQAGVTNAVASMGTSLTDTQASALTRIAETIVICYDSDSAGTEASFRAAELLQRSGKMIRIARMPDGLDPDDYIREYGGERFKSEVIGASQTLMAFKMDYFRRKRNLSDEGDRLLYIEEVVREIAALRRAVEREHYLQLLSEEFSISLDTLKRQTIQMAKEAKRKETRRQQGQAFIPDPKRQLRPAHEMAERRLLARMMRSREISDRVQEALGGSFSVDAHQALAAHLYAFYESGNSPDEGLFICRLKDPKLQKVATGLSMMPLNEPPDEKEIEDCIRQVVRHSQAALIAGKEEERKKAEQSGDYTLAARLVSEIIGIKKQLNVR